MELFEFIPTPVKVRNLYLEIKASLELLATDERGQAGIKMSREQLVRCQAGDKHNGKVFLCPNANLIRNDNRKSCLGAIFFGLQEEIGKRCDHWIG